MRSMKRFIIMLSLLTVLFFACKDKYEFENVVVKDFGSPAVDGCGWVIEISSEIYKPLDLAQEFQIDELPVRIKYELLSSKANCGFAQNVYYEIEIREIEKR